MAVLHYMVCISPGNDSHVPAASFAGHRDTVAALLLGGADPYLPNKMGVIGRDEVASLLR